MDHASDESSLGLRRGQVCLVPHDPRWDELYRQEEERIRAAMGDELIAIEHFGSTSIPGLQAKPILDILAAVRQLDDALRCRSELEATGYEHAFWAGVPEHHVFGKGKPVRTHLLHVVEYGGRHWTENLGFRDSLRAAAELAAEYDALKRHLAECYPEERARYTQAKADFIQRIRERPPPRLSGSLAK